MNDSREVVVKVLIYATSNEAEKRLGLGTSLLATLAERACQQQCARFEWNVLDWNTPAIKVYRAAGAQPQSELNTWRV